MAKIIRKTTTLTRTTKKGGKVVRRYRKTATLTRKVKKAPVTAGVAI